jgi:hypothetical protein
MAHVAGHLSIEALEARYEACESVMSSRHFQTIWFLAKGAFDRRGCREAAAAQPEGGDAKKVAEVVDEEAALHPDTPIEAFATDVRRFGLTP